jgi:hypothetical protein
VLEKHLHEDQHALFPLYIKFTEHEKADALSIEVFGSVIRSFFLLMLHKHEIGDRYTRKQLVFMRRRYQNSFFQAGTTNDEP